MWKIVLVGVLVALFPVPAFAECEQADSAQAKVHLVLDSSGSMKENDASGRPKIQSAKTALNTVIDQLPSNAQVGMRVFGAKVFDRSDPGACADSQQVVPVGPVDKNALRQAVGSYKPFGETPIAYALQQAAKDLGSEGKRSIVLVSDGEETCDQDPAKVAQQIRKSGVDLSVDVVGFGVSGGTRRKLERIAEAGGGIYFDADNQEDLTAVLGQSASRAFRPFTVAGTPVRGRSEPEGAPELLPGRYTDELGPSGDVTGLKYYTLKVRPGSTVHAGVTMRPERAGDTVESEIVDLALYPPGSDDECATGRSAKVDVGAERRVLAGGLFHGPDGTSKRSDPDDACLSSERLVLEVSRGSRKDDRTTSATPKLDPIEVTVVEEPRVTNLDELPAAGDKDDVRAEPVRGTAPQREVAGGASFNEAPTLTPGTWTDTIQPGEQLFYRVRVDWGQAPAVSFRMKANPGADVDRGVRAPSADMAVFGPNRTEATNSLAPGTRLAAGWRPERDLTLNAGIPAVRYRNRESGGHLAATSSAGFYYFSFAVNDSGTCWETPLEINVAVDGEVTGVPAYEKTEPETEPGTNSDDSDGTNGSTAEDARTGPDPIPIAVAGIGLLGVVLLVLGIAAVRRRPNSPPGRR